MRWFAAGVLGAFTIIYTLIFLASFDGCATQEARVIDKFHHCGGPGEVRCRLRAWQAQPWEAR